MAILTSSDNKAHALRPTGSTIGRLRNCDIVVSDPSVSRRHAKVWKGKDGWRVRDLGSRAGIRVDGRQVEEALLKAGSVIQVGGHRFTLSEGQQVKTTPSELVTQRNLVSSKSIYGSVLMSKEKADEGMQETLGRIVRVASAARAATTPEAVAQAVLSEALMATGATRGLMRLNAKDGSTKATYYANDQEFTPSSTFINRVLYEEVALVAMDVEQDDELNVAHSIAMHHVGSLLCAPLWTGSRVAGVLYLDRRSGSFAPEAVELMLVLGYLGAAELDRVFVEADLDRERTRRRMFARLLPSNMAQGLASTSGELSLHNAPIALAFAEVVDLTGTAGSPPPEFLDTIADLVLAKSAGHEVEADGDQLGVLFWRSDDPGDDAIAAAHAAVQLMQLGEALRETREEWSGFRIRAGIFCADATVGVYHIRGGEQFRVVGEVWENGIEFLRGGMPGRILVSGEASPHIANAFQVVPERDGDQMKIWLIPN